MNILLIAGGWSSEREVSLSGSRGIEKSLRELGHTVTFFDPATSLSGLPAAAGAADFAFIALHGSPGEDGLIQAMLESIGCPYQGSGPAASFLALNKAAGKELFRHHGIATPDWELLAAHPGAQWKAPFAFPLFIKINTGGSSLRMERVASQEEVPGALDRLFAQGGEFLVEPSVPGLELTCGVLERPEGGEDALPPVLIRPARPGDVFFDYASKYTPNGAEELCPAPLPQAVCERIQEISLRAHRILGLSGYSRSDFILHADGTPYLLEVNTLPGMTPTSLLPQEAAVCGLGFTALVGRLVELGLARFRRMQADPAGLRPPA